jgi:hypothetical protein
MFAFIKKLSLGLGVLWAGISMIVPSVQAVTVEDLEAKIEQMQEQYNRQIEQMSLQIRQLKMALEGEAPPSRAGSEEKSIPGMAQEFADKGISPKFGGLYTKPFLKRFGRNTYVGGYVDLEYQDSENATKNFDQVRLIPFIYADISERVKFATEIEFEHGGTNNNQGDGEVKVEFATMDYLINDWVNFRGGILLSPLGRYNLLHDSPLQEIATRPIVDRFIIPTTLSESGAGLYGSFYPTEVSKLDYELYLTNGFKGLTAQGVSNIDTSNGLRDARGSQQANLKDALSFVGRLTYSPFLGLDIAYSTHLGHYDQLRDNVLWISAADITYQNGPLELLAEFAYDAIERDTFAIASGVPDDLWGYYLQANYRFMPKSLQELAPTIFRDESTFALVARWDQVNMDGNTKQRVTPGVTFRPISDMVFGLNYQVNRDNGSHGRVQDDVLEAWFATYF